MSLDSCHQYVIGCISFFLTGPKTSSLMPVEVRNMTQWQQPTYSEEDFRLIAHIKFEDRHWPQGFPGGAEDVRKSIINAGFAAPVGVKVLLDSIGRTVRMSAFVKFKTPADAAAFCGRYRLNGFSCKVEPHDSDPSPLLDLDPNWVQDSRTLCLLDLPTWSIESLSSFRKEILHQQIPIHSVKLLKNFTGGYKSFGFVTFADKLTTWRFLKIGCMRLYGEVVRVVSPAEVVVQEDGDPMLHFGLDSVGNSSGLVSSESRRTLTLSNIPCRMDIPVDTRIVEEELFTVWRNQMPGLPLPQRIEFLADRRNGVLTGQANVVMTTEADADLLTAIRVIQLGGSVVAIRRPEDFPQDPQQGVEPQFKGVPSPRHYLIPRGAGQGQVEVSFQGREEPETHLCRGHSTALAEIPKFSNLLGGNAVAGRAFYDPKALRWMTLDEVLDQLQSHIPTSDRIFSEDRVLRDVIRMQEQLSALSVATAENESSPSPVHLRARDQNRVDLVEHYQQLSRAVALANRNGEIQATAAFLKSIEPTVSLHKPVLQQFPIPSSTSGPPSVYPYQLAQQLLNRFVFETLNPAVVARHSWKQLLSKVQLSAKLGELVSAEEEAMLADAERRATEADRYLRQQYDECIPILRFGFPELRARIRASIDEPCGLGSLRFDVSTEDFQLTQLGRQEVRADVSVLSRRTTLPNRKD